MSGALWTGVEAARAAGARVIGETPASISGVSIDSRTIRPGELYVSIRGDVHDGHDFAQAALERGAAAALVSEAKIETLGGAGPLFAATDSLQGLEALGRAARARSTARIVAVTGSAGKTGTKEMLALALSRQGETHFSVASFNNHWGVPLTLARMPQTVRFGVFEIGMNHAGEITPLTKMVRPHVAIVTTIAPVHLAFFSSLAAIADAKAEIFSGLEPEGVAVINSDNPQAKRLALAAEKAGARVVFFGGNERAGAKLLYVDLQAEKSEVKAMVRGQTLSYSLRNPGLHIVMNSLAALAAADAVDADVGAAAQALSDAPPPKGRGAREILLIDGRELVLIDESYNANPSSMRAALDNLGRMAPMDGGRRIAILGDMLELGDAGRDFHRDLAQCIERNRIDLVFASGPLMRALWDELSPSRRGAYAASAAELSPSALDALAPGDVVTVKGSLGSRMGPIVTAMRARFAAPVS